MRVKIDDDESAAMDPRETLQLLRRIEANTATIGNQADDDIRASVAEVQTLKKKVRSNYRSGRMVGPRNLYLQATKENELPCSQRILEIRKQNYGSRVLMTIETCVRIPVSSCVFRRARN